MEKMKGANQSLQRTRYPRVAELLRSAKEGAVTPSYSIIIPEDTVARAADYLQGYESAGHSPEPSFMIASKAQTFER